MSACALCGDPRPQLFASSQGGAVCRGCADYGAGEVSERAIRFLADLAGADLRLAGDMGLDGAVRKESRAMLYGFAEYYLERRMRSFPLLASGLGMAEHRA